MASFHRPRPFCLVSRINAVYSLEPGGIITRGCEDSGFLQSVTCHRADGVFVYGNQGQAASSGNRVLESIDGLPHLAIFLSCGVKGKNVVYELCCQCVHKLFY